MSDKHDSTGITAQVLAGGLASVRARPPTAAVERGPSPRVEFHTAGIASVVTTIAATVYLRSIQTTRARVKLVRARTVPTPPEEGATEKPRRPRWPALIAAAVLAFALGMAVITGVEWITGDRISGGQGTTIGEVVRPRPGPSPVKESTPPSTSTTSSPSSTGQSTTSTPQASTSTTSPPSTTTTTSTSTSALATPASGQ